MDRIKIDVNSFLSIYDNISNDIIIYLIPGGGYDHISLVEGMPVANKFLDLGYNVAILNYATKNFKIALPFKEAYIGLCYLKKKYKYIFVLGFSAGGHLASLLGCYYHSLIDGLILGYPLITFKDEYTHLMARKIFLDNKINKKNINRFSIEENVGPSFPKTFIFAFKNDESVCIENTNLLISSLKKNKVYYESYIYEFGRHGMSLANLEISLLKNNDPSYIDEKIAKWPNLANNFIKKVVRNE